MKAIIIGGVAAGAGAAARLRRLDEQAEIILLERGDFMSYANCGLPYHLGGVIPDRESLLVMTPPAFSARFNVDIRLGHEAVSIDRAAKTVTVRRPDGFLANESYDKLLLATGSTPLSPALPGVDNPRVMPLWTIPDLDRLKKIVDAGARSALIVGGGFIGLETAENLRARGLEVALVELMDQVLPTMDREMTVPLAAELKKLGVSLMLGRKVAAFKPASGGVVAILDNGGEIPADVAVLSIGVKPNSELALGAGLTLGERGHIVVDECLRTSDPDIHAAGDAVEVVDPILGGRIAVPLAGPANKQGRVAADNMAGRASRYQGSLGASIVKLGSLAAGSVGHTERRLRRAGVDFRTAYLHPAASALYYPGSSRLAMKLLFTPEGGILGAQIVGAGGVDKRIDVIATAIRARMNVTELAELELSYAPPFNAAKDPVNMAGMIAGNILSGDTTAIGPDELPNGAYLLDVREASEFAAGAIPGAVNIPLGQLRKRLAEIPAGKRIVAYCQIGFRGYVAERLLRQRGFSASNLSGGYATWKLFNPPSEARPNA